MRVTIFTAFDTVLNPYILLFKKALEGQGLTVQLERDFNLNWLIAKGSLCDSIHLHWINLSYTPPKKHTGSYFYRRLIGNRLVKASLDLLCLIDFALTFLFAKLTRKVIVFTVHDLYQFGEQSLRWKLQIEAAHWVVFQLSDSIHVHNHFTRKLIAKRYRRKRRVTVIPHGNFIGYYPNKVSKSEARRNLKLSADAFVYLFLGLLRPYKGLEDLFAAFKKLKDPKARLLVAGKVFGNDHYQAKLMELRRSDSRIRLMLEFVPDEAIQMYLNSCDIFVLPYKNITTSGAATLALSFGRPILAPAITSFPEVITSHTGILYKACQSNGLLLALQEAKTRSWSEPKIFNYAHQFDWEKLGPKLASLYRKPSINRHLKK